MNDLTSYSPIREQIVVTSHHTGKPGMDELWLSGTGGESPRKICDVPHYSRVALAPDTERIALSTQDGIYIQSINSGERKKIRPVSGIDAVAVWWHPSGHVLGFLDTPGDRKMRAWQMNDDGTNLRRIVAQRFDQGVSRLWPPRKRSIPCFWQKRGTSPCTRRSPMSRCTL